MIPLSKRHAPALLALGIATAVPVWLHSLNRFDRDDCASPAALRDALGADGSPPVGPYAPDRPDIVQSLGGNVVWGGPSKPPLSFAVVRSTDPPRLTGLPYRPVLNDLEVVRRELRWLEDGEGNALPLRSVFGYPGQRVRFASYLFVYEGQPVLHPTLAIAASAPVRILSGARPITLLVVGGAVARGDMGQARKAAEDWILDAWSRYRRSCHL